MSFLTKIAAVVVTHNRLALLKECLSAIRSQERHPEIMFVVNNGSTDGTREFLDAEQGIIVIHQENLGGAGGFFTGFKAAYEWGADAIWCMDDDTIPYPVTLSGLLHTAEVYAGLQKTKPLGWVGSVDVWTDGAMHVMNRPKLSPGCDWLSDCARLQAVPAYFSSYVSILFTREAIRRAGYPMKELFIWGDDVEHTLRVTGAGFEGLVSFASPCLHKTAKNESSSLKYLNRTNLWKYEWHFRNFAYLDSCRWYLKPGKRFGMSFETMWRTLTALCFSRRFWAIRPVIYAMITGAFAKRRVVLP